MSFVGPVDANYLRAWGRHTHRSPLYARLVELTAERPDLLGVIQQIHNRPPPNVYLAAIQYLLMNNPDEALAGFYASITDDPRPVAEVDEAFIEFVTRNEGRIVDIANSRLTQTNEARRCVALLPGVMASPHGRFHLVEIGSSAGLNLALDHYRYDYEGLTWGPAGSLTLEAGVRGDGPRLRPIEVGRRIGIDVNVLDLADPGDLRWLDALIWPEHAERRQRLRRAFELTRNLEREMVEGSVLDRLEPVLGDLPAGEPVVVMNSFVLIQLDEEERFDVAAIINAARTKRPIHRVSLELIDKDDDWARLEVGDGLDLVDLGRAHPHGEWVELRYP